MCPSHHYVRYTFLNLDQWIALPAFSSSPVTSDYDFSVWSVFLLLCVFAFFGIFVQCLALWLCGSLVTSDNDFGVVYDSDYNDYSVVLPDK